MISKHLYIQLILRVLFLCATCVCMTYFFIEEKHIWSLLLGLLLIIQVITLVIHLNTTNRKIAYFIKSLINEDFTLSFETKKNPNSLNELNITLNALNAKIQEVHIKNQAQEKYYQELLKQAEIGVLTLNTKGHILFVNPKAEKLLNYSPLNHIKHIKRVSEELYQILNTSNSFDRKLIKLSNERETKQLAIKLTKIQLNAEHIQLVTLQDIRSELDTKETSSWIKLIKVLTHEIMNSVTPITSITESLLRYQDATTETPTTRGLQVIKDQSDDLVRFIESYRSFLNVPKPTKKIIVGATFFKRIEFIFKDEMLKKNIDFNIKIFDVKHTFYADEQQFSQVIINLIRNATQALKETKNAKIEILITAEEGKTNIRVLDNGKGISKEELTQIFVPFFTTKEKGTGIGLSLSKQILQLHGGSLEVFSKLNEKTVFTIKL